MKKINRKTISIILYFLPIIFFIVSYFLITTSGEDIFQGANNLRTGIQLNPIGDAINAFNFNSRITDMYAWPIIDLFDYQFSFGPDIIFRLIDVIIATAVFYFSTYIVLNHKPRLVPKDALTFCLIFISFIITPFGRVFYLEFSMIHNYIPLALTTLVISIPYLKLLQNQPIKHQKALNIFMPFFGLYFGMAATVTPIAFLFTIIIYLIIKRKKPVHPPLWFFSGIITTIIGFLICWLVGSGIEHYTSAQAIAFDYVSLSNLFANPLTYIPKLLWHEIYNFDIVLLPLLVLFILCYLFSKPKIQFKKLDKITKNYILVFGIFIIIHILGASLIKAPFRILIPAYLAGVIIIIKLFVKNLNSRIVKFSVVILTLSILVIHTILLINYHNKTSVILNEIKNSPENNLCIEESRTLPSRINIVDLSQANFLVDWGYPEPIYGKNITFCKE